MLRTDITSLTLLPFRQQDQAPLSALLINEKIKETYMIPDFADDAALGRMVRRFLELSPDPAHFVRGIYLKDRLIGFLNDVEITKDYIELGYVIDPAFWGNGYATEALRQAIACLLAQGFTAVRTGAFADNIASLRVMEKCGMHHIPHTEAIKYRGKTHLCIYYEA